MQALTSECFISMSGLGEGMTSREGLAKKDQRLWEMPLLPSGGTLSQMLGHSSASSPSSAPSPAMPAYHIAWFHCQEIRHYLQEEGGGEGHSYTRCPNLKTKAS